MSLRGKLITLFSIYCIVLNCQPTLANPAEHRVARSNNDWYDWISTLFDDSDETDEQYLLCRNCTIIVEQGQKNNGTDAPAAQSTAAPPPAPPTTPSAGGNGVASSTAAAPPVAGDSA